MADEKQTPPEKEEVFNDPDQDTYWRWLKLPAPYCDTWAVDAWPTGVVRLTFAEFTTKGYLPFFRSAVVLPHSDARDLANAIIRDLDSLAAEEKKNKETKE